jgi:TrmH family RNA methyltransferase
MITSTSNMHVRTIRSLRDNRSLRRSERMFVLEGVRLVADLLTSGATPVLALYDAEQLMRTSAGQHLLAQLHALPHCHAASTAVVNAASDTTNPQGVVAVARWPQHVLPLHPQLVVVCDHIQDPGNLGTIIRSCDAVGVDVIYCSVGCVDAYAPKTVRASMGSLMRVPVLTDMSWDTIADAVAHCHVYGADSTPTSLPYTQVDWRVACTLIVGNEAHGMSQDAQALTTASVVIPMRPGIESLNAAMATSIILFEAQRQRQVG